MVSVGFKTDRGRQRQNNEDSLFVLPEQQLYIVADGVGGHNSGELASRMSVGYMAQYVAMNPMDGIRQKRELKRYFRHCFEGENERRSIEDVLKEVPEGADITIMIGPEGDFSPEEARLAVENGFIPVHLGPSRLRTESAAVVAATAVYLHYLK